MIVTQMFLSIAFNTLTYPNLHVYYPHHSTEEHFLNQKEQDTDANTLHVNVETLDTVI